MKRVSRKRASKRPSGEGQRKGASAPRSRILMRLTSLAQIGEVARRLVICHLMLTVVKSCLYRCYSLIAIWSLLACEQALLFGRVKRVSRKRASKRPSGEGQRKGASAPRSRILMRLTSLAQIGEVARRLVICHLMLTVVKSCMYRC